VASTTTSIAPPAIARSIVVKAVPRRSASIQPTVRHASARPVASKAIDDSTSSPWRVRHLREKHRAELAGAESAQREPLAGREAAL